MKTYIYVYEKKSITVVLEFLRKAHIYLNEVISLLIFKLNMAFTENQCRQTSEFSRYRR